jgi:hypothetical protein
VPPDLADRGARLERFVNALLSAFPQDVRAVYIHGSHANNTAIPGSDVDLVVVLTANARTPDIHRFAEERQPALPFTLDIVCVDESLVDDRPHAPVAAALKWNSRLLAGTAIDVEHMAPSLAGFLEQAGACALLGIAGLRDRAEIWAPVGYPEPAGEFFGYDRIQEAPTQPSGQAPGTRELIATASWSASAFLARSAGVIAPSRMDAFSMYPVVIRDEWSPLLAAIHDQCRLEWSGEIPESANDRSALRKVCARFVLFENHVLDVFGAS